MHADSWQASFIVIEGEWKVRCDTNCISAEETCSNHVIPSGACRKGSWQKILLRAEMLSFGRCTSKTRSKRHSATLCLGLGGERHTTNITGRLVEYMRLTQRRLRPFPSLPQPRVFSAIKVCVSYEHLSDSFLLSEIAFHKLLRSPRWPSILILRPISKPL